MSILLALIVLGNLIGNDGVALLARGVAKNTTLRVLDLRRTFSISVNTNASKTTKFEKRALNCCVHHWEKILV